MQRTELDVVDTSQIFACDGSLDVWNDLGDLASGDVPKVSILRARDKRAVEDLRARRIVQRPEDLGIDPLDAHRSMLAARSVKDLMHWSGGLYDPPAKYRNW